MPNTEECFIIMPITMPEHMLKAYRDGEQHFQHVLDCLFMPAITKAGYNPKPPKAKGADIIHAEIVRNIETASLVLCDMSCLNPNVFFEFGIRTALNKSVCVVKDDKTENIPFDAAVMNCQDYISSIEAWNVDVEIDKLVAHIKASANQSKGGNNFWKYFGLKSKAVPYESEDPVNAKLDYLGLQVEASTQRLASVAEMVMQLQNHPVTISKLRATEPEETTYSDQLTKEQASKLFKVLESMLPEGVEFVHLKRSIDLPRRTEIGYRGRLTQDSMSYLAQSIYEKLGLKVRFKQLSDKPASRE